MWDDHDYGPNNSDATAPGRKAARLTYQQYVPHYPLAAGEGNVPLYHAFTVGRTRFIMTDLRSERTPDFSPDDGSKSMMGEGQKMWFKRELLAAKDRYKLIVWVSTVPWIAAAEAGEDHWGGFSRERQEIADFIEANGIEPMLMLSGDAHMLAIDDGSNNRFASNGEGPGFPVFQAAALDRFRSTKGGPYSHGVSPGGGQFGLVTVADRGGETITVTLSGRDSEDKVVMAHTFTVSPALAAVADADVRITTGSFRPGWVLLPLLLLLALLVYSWQRRQVG
jgi:alkaline phosphatase D